MSESDIAQIKDRLTRLETIFEERWLSHGRRADERWADLMDKMHELSSKTTPCQEHIRLMSDMHGRIKNIEDWKNFVMWSLGVIYIAVVGAIVKLIMG